jgi:hypothetical protein
VYSSSLGLHLLARHASIGFMTPGRAAIVVIRGGGEAGGGGKRGEFGLSGDGMSSYADLSDRSIA